MKFLVLPILLSFLFILPTYATDIPQELQQIGFTKYTLISYEKIEDKEFLTFSDWRTEKSGDTITFIIIDGKVNKYFKIEEEIS